MNNYAYVEGNPLSYTDPTGNCPWCIVVLGWGAFELAMSAYDAYDTAKTIADPCQSAWQKTSAAGLFGLGMVAPGGGYGPLLKKIPNPFGRKGGPAHQAKVAEVADDIRSRGLEVGYEHRIPTPGGTKGSRAVDVVGKDGQGNVVEMHQVGRQTKGGAPVSREVKALDDIEKATQVRPNYHPYN